MSCPTKLSVFVLGSADRDSTWGARQIIAAETPEQASLLAKWDYYDQTKWCDKMEGVQATGEPRVLFRNDGG